jgi:hypothetical protein
MITHLVASDRMRITRQCGVTEDLHRPAGRIDVGLLLPTPRL